MPQLKDELGLSYSASEALSLNKFNAVMDYYLCSSNQTMPALDSLIESDPRMPMARMMRVYLLKLASDPKFNQPVNLAMQQLSGDKAGFNRRELAHFNALTAWCQKDTNQALHILEDQLTRTPKDMLALRLCHHLHFYAGDAVAMRNSVARSLLHWQPGELFYSYLLGMYSFGLEESGHYAKAESNGREAVSLNPADQWATHAVAHVMEMQNRYDEGIEWLGERLPGFEDSNNFVYHLHWHKALFHLGDNDPDQALDIYDQHLRTPLADDFYLDLCNATSLLWRLEMRGMDVKERWQELNPYGDRRIKDDELVFTSLHYLMPAAKLKHTAATKQALDHFKSWAASEGTQAEVALEVGQPIADAMVALGQGAYQQAADELNRITPRLFSIGGSHAQRRLFLELESYARGLAER